jgi:hypothetical protein
MVKKATLNELDQMLTHVVEHVATKEDIEQLHNADAKTGD